MTDDPDIAEAFYSYSNEDIGVEAGEVAVDMFAAIARHLWMPRGSSPTTETSTIFWTMQKGASLGPSAMELRACGSGPRHSGLPPERCQSDPGRPG